MSTRSFVVRSVIAGTFVCSLAIAALVHHLVV